MGVNVLYDPEIVIHFSREKNVIIAFGLGLSLHGLVSFNVAVRQIYSNLQRSFAVKMY